MTEQHLPEGWEMVKFGDIAKHISKRVEPSETDLEIYVGLEHLDPDSLKIKRYGTPSDVEGQKLLVKKGQIIFGKRRAYQRKIALADWDCICSAHAMVLEANPKYVIPDFLPYFMQSSTFMDRAVAISEGSLSPTIKWKVLASQTFILPPKNIQFAIVSKLLAALEVSNKNEELIASAERLYFSLINKVYNKKGSTVKLGTLIKKISSGKSLSAGATPASENEKGVLKVSAVSNGLFIPSENKIVNNKDTHLLKLNPRLGDILMSRANTADLVGDVCIVERDYYNLYLPDKLWVVEAKSSELNLWVFHLLRYLKFRGVFSSLASGTSGSMKNISQEKFLDIDVVEPINFHSIGSMLQNAYKTTNNIYATNGHVNRIYRTLLDESLSF